MMVYKADRRQGIARLVKLLESGPGLISRTHIKCWGCRVLIIPALKQGSELPKLAGQTAYPNQVSPRPVTDSISKEVDGLPEDDA